MPTFFPIRLAAFVLVIRHVLRVPRLLPIALCMLIVPQYALANLMLHPTRVVFENNQRAAQLELVNNGTETATYRISLVNRRMSETGEFSEIEIPAAGEQFADAMLRYSPRQVTLAPGAGQVVRIMLRKPAGLAPGEYRSHLLFERLPDAAPAGSRANGEAADKEIGIRLKVLVGASIPVIVRHGETSAALSLSNIELQRGKPGQPPSLALQINRTGNRSAYGDITVTFTPEGQTEHLLAKAGGVAVYTPNSIRYATIPLQLPERLALARGTLRITYREPGAGGRLLAAASLDVH